MIRLQSAAAGVAVAATVVVAVERTTVRFAAVAGLHFACGDRLSSSRHSILAAPSSKR